MFDTRFRPAGYTAAIYAGRSGLQPVIYEGLQPGSQLTITTEIENYPGFPEGIDANEMMDDMRKQALRFGTEIRPASAVKVDLSQAPYKVWFDDDTMEECQTLIIATGASAKYLGLADEKKYQGMGRERLRHLRRILLSQKSRSRSRWW